MIDKDVIIEKVNRIQNCLQRIYKTVSNDVSRLDSYDVQDIVTLNLQRGIQLTIDLAAHTVRSESLGMPQTLKENFHILWQNKIISSSLKEKMEHMVGFRNIAVHDYESINPEILKSIVKNHLVDIEEFYTTLIRHFGLV